jgi:hypothetical protein
MDEMARTEYMRAKGMSTRLPCPARGQRASSPWMSSYLRSMPTNITLQLSSPTTLPSLPRPIFLCRNISPYKRRAFLLGNLSRNLKLQTASSKAGPKLNSSTRSVPY